MAARHVLAIGLAALGLSAQALGQDRPSISGLRAEEDWRPFCAAGAARAPLKCLGDEDLRLSLGGELRERVEAARNPALGLAQVDRDSVLLHRLLLHADLRAGPHMRLFVQLANLAATDRATATPPTDRNRLDLQQGFVELSAPLGAGRLALRAGRQELAFGSQRLVTVRDGPNARLSFDGARLSHASGAWRTDAIAVRAVQPEPGLFDDQRDGPHLWGVHATNSRKPGTGLDLYYLGYSRPRGRFDRATAAEERHSLGMRLFGRRKAGDWVWDWDWEGVWQGGTFGEQRIRAWTLATITAVSRPEAALSPRFGLSVNIASGDRRNGDGTLGTFNPLFPRAPYFTEAAINAPANLMNIDPFVELRPARGLTLRLSHDSLWRASRDDAFYTMPTVPLIAGDRSRARRIGSQTELRAQWQANRHLGFAGSLVHFEAGPFVRESGGRSQQYLMLSSTARF